MKLNKVAAIGAAVAVVFSGAFAAPAFADPVSNSYVAVGSDTLQDSMNALTNGTNITGSFVRVVTPDGTTTGNFDAFGSAAIQTKPSGKFFARPNGSGAGVTALRASIDGTRTFSVSNNLTPAVAIKDQVDIARSSGGPGTNANNAGKLLYVPYARDAVMYAYKGGTAAWANITAAQLKQIYDGTLTSIDGVTIKPRLPQTSSGTRNFFLGALGYSAPSGSSTITAPAVNDTNNVTPENDATVLGANEIIPFSVASWVAQANGAAGVNTIAASTGVSVGSPVAGQVPFTGTGAALVPNQGFYSNTTFGRDTYLVVERARVENATDPKFDAGLAALVDMSDPNSLASFVTVTSGASGSVKKKFGFLAPLGTSPIAAYPTI